MAEQWFYWGDGDACGPVSLDEVTALVRGGEITAASDVRRRTEVGWSKAAVALPELFVVADANGKPIPTTPRNSWKDRSPHPWRRYFARLLDSAVVGTATWAIIGALAYSINPSAAAEFFEVFTATRGGRLLDGILTLAVAIPGNALMIGLTGLSLGKWIFGVRILKDERPIGLRAAFSRELRVWVLGFGLAVPIISMITLLLSYRRVLDRKPTLWDQDVGATVVHRPASFAANLLMFAGVVLLVLLLVWLRGASQ